jgi:hypothetical protein
LKPDRQKPLWRKAARARMRKLSYQLLGRIIHVRILLVDSDSLLTNHQPSALRKKYELLGEEVPRSARVE